MPMIEPVFDDMRLDAEVLVRQIKDLAFDDAIVVLLQKWLDVRSAAQEAVLTEVAERLSHTAMQHLQQQKEA